MCQERAVSPTRSDRTKPKRGTRRVETRNASDTREWLNLPGVSQQARGGIERSICPTLYIESPICHSPFIDTQITPETTSYARRCSTIIHHPPRLMLNQALPTILQ